MKRIDEVIGTYNSREYHLSVQVVLLRSLKKRRERDWERRDEILQKEKMREEERWKTLECKLSMTHAGGEPIIFFI